MAKKVLLDTYLSIGGTDLSNYLSKVELKWKSDTEESTTFGSLGFREYLPGLRGGSIGATFKTDYANSALDDIMFALVGTLAAFEIRPDADVAGPNNPKYTGTLVVEEWNSIMGEVGKIAEVQVNYKITGALTRAEI